MVTIRVKLEATVEIDFEDLIHNNIQELIDDMTVEDLSYDGELTIEEA